MNLALADVHEHVGVREPLHRTLERRLSSRLLWLLGRDRRITSSVRVREQRFPAKVVLEHLTFRDGYDSIVVEPEPTPVGRGLDQDKVVTAVHVSRVHENSVQFVVERFRSISFRIEVRGEVDFEGEFMSIVDLCEHGPGRQIGTP